MLDLLLYWLVRFLLGLRYRTVVTGLRGMKRGGRPGILFLPNHPALIDPLIVITALFKNFRVRPLGYQDQIDRPVIRRLAGRIRALPIPEMAKAGSDGRQVIEQAIAAIIRGLQEGENILLYPSGRTYRSRYEEIGGTSAVATIVKAVPGARVALIRTTGLWGSAFSRAAGKPPLVKHVLKKACFAVLANGIFFMPRRRVTVECVEPADFPREADRLHINRYLEEFYNITAPPHTYVPYLWWERGGTRVFKEPSGRSGAGDPGRVPSGVRQQVLGRLEDMSGGTGLKDTDRLGSDLGMDSLMLAELSGWLEQEFGFQQGYADSLRTVGDTLLAACGETVSIEPEGLRAVRAAWFKNFPCAGSISPCRSGTLTEAFLCQAEAAPHHSIVADQRSGEKTYRDLVTALLVLKPELEKICEQHIGIMLPASVACTTLYWAALFAGKVPVMVNWTIGSRNLQYLLECAEVKTVLTAREFVRRLSDRGWNPSACCARMLYIDDIVRDLSIGKKIGARLAALDARRSLRGAEPARYAVMLFTSGSESLPKIVPLTHANIFSNIRDIVSAISVDGRDRLMGILPPFHSLGLTTTVVLPLCSGIPTVYHPNPTEAALIAQTIEAYRATIMLGTPTFLHGVARVAGDEQLASLRLAVTGAEKCPDSVYELLSRRCPQVNVLEGYGTTECSPVVSAADENSPRPGTIGKVLPSFRYAVVDPDTLVPVARGQRGVLLVSGPAVFEGYYRSDGPSPFVELDGTRWYRTGDLVVEDEGGVLTFAGRLKRFVKLGGEMISLPAVESVLAPHLATGKDDKPCCAVEATSDESHPELVLFTTVPVDRITVNAYIRDSGLSPLHNIRRVVQLDEIPLLGTGKTDYRALKKILHDEGG